jgi:GrpB-like predicted nucleotidyltransferase (UPF0157 family)
MSIVNTNEFGFSEYDPSWPDRFESLASPLRTLLNGIDAEIEHVGSTSVPGLAAKPIIDIDIVVTTKHDLVAVTERLQSIGYLAKGTRGIPGREAFDQPPDLPTHHLYAIERGSKPYLDHMLLRDLLRRRDDLRQRYAQVKREHAHLLGAMDRMGYQDAKSDVIAELLNLARSEARLSDPTIEVHGAVTYRWRESFPDSEVDDLHGLDTRGLPFGWRRARPLSLGWVTARAGDRLVGFGNVAWDGHRHAFLLDVVVAAAERRKGIGTQLVARAIHEARQAECEWIHVDFESHLTPFYEGCGFLASAAGVLRLG